MSALTILLDDELFALSCMLTTNQTIRNFTLHIIFEWSEMIIWNKVRFAQKIQNKQLLRHSFFARKQRWYEYTIGHL